MDNYNLNIERTVLASYFYADITGRKFDKINENLFYLPFHQKIAVCINWLIEKDKPTHEHIVRHYLAVNNRIGHNEDNIIIDIMAANPLSNMDSYLVILEELKTKRDMTKLWT